MRRATAAAAAASLLSACGFWRDAVPPEWSARDLPARYGVVEIEADRNDDDAFAKVLTLDGRDAVVSCESVPCRAVVAPGRYRLVVGMGGLPWIEAYSADVPLEVAPCATDRVRVELAFKLSRGEGRVLRRDRVPLAADPHRVRPAPAGCAADAARGPDLPSGGR